MEPNDPEEDDSAQQLMPRLQSQRSSARFEQIAELRARGVGDHIDLPQLVVCGDQSSGKSSVLEGVTGIPFPRQEGLCTSFPTEIILEHSNQTFSIFSTIIPSKSRTSEERTKLSKFQRQLETFADLPTLISEAGQLMCVRGHTLALDDPAFVEDVLRIKVVGRTGLNLTIVDLPGLFENANEEQSEEDNDLVHRMVDSYAENPRTIILAVVQAVADIAVQGIIRKSRRFDKAGERTLGIITKPDLINEGSEKRIALLSRNQDTTKLRLGFFLLKNPSPAEISNGITAEQRQKREMQFFQASPWREQNLDYDRVGIASLRSTLQKLLDQHVERELPKVREEVKSLLKKTEGELVALGEPRPTITHERMFLSRVSMHFHRLVLAALDGNYHEVDSEFFEDRELDSNSVRLRAIIHRLNSAFSEYMAQNGQKRKVGKKPETEMGLGFEKENEEEVVEDQILVTEQGMREWVKEVYLSNRGKELPGTYNHILLSELFHIQSSRWIDIAKDHVDDVFQRMTRFVKASLKRVTMDQHLFHELLDLVQSSLEMSRKAADNELKAIWEDEKAQPITYNHYYTDNIQNARQDFARNHIRKHMQQVSEQEYGGRMHVGNTPVEIDKLVNSLQKHIIYNMDEQACTEALSGLNAYYKVARKTFVDNVCRQVIERHLLRNLPQLFQPETVAALSDEDLARIASEPAENKEKRESLQKLVESLQSSLRKLRK